MTQLVLHHYPTSPFAEKIRLILGFKQLPWHSVVIPNIMPKPDVVALTGGYRRTPFLQMGADIYCDTALICDVLEQRAPEPTLYPEHCKGEARIVAQWADNLMFPVAMAYNFQPAGVAQVFADATPEQIKSFVQDRAAMRGGAPRMPGPDASAMYKSYLRRLANMLDDRAYLLGAQACVADFSAYHSLWFTLNKTPVMAGILDATPNVRDWVQRMAQFGHSTSQDMTSAQALALAQSSTPAALPKEPFQDEHGIALGSEVVVVAESFGLEPTQGTLLAATRTRYVLRRADPRAGVVHVHFPRTGFLLKKAEA
jgi:glutathione S-transferase